MMNEMKKLPADPPNLVEEANLIAIKLNSSSLRAFANFSRQKIHFNRDRFIRNAFKVNKAHSDGLNSSSLRALRTLRDK
jgi:hypothetical protein